MKPVTLCALLSVGLHAAWVVSAMGQAAPPKRPAAPRISYVDLAPARTPDRTALTLPGAQPHPPAARPTRERQAPPAATRPRAAPAAEEVAAAPPEALALAVAEHAVAPPAGLTEPDPIEAVSSGALDGIAAVEGAGFEDYFPRQMLTLGPVVEAAPLIPYPDAGPSLGHFVAVLALYIDESGRVRRVRVDGEPLPPALEQAARESFLAARFKPGELDGMRVKSLIRVEITFDSRPLQAASTLRRDAAID